ncbi:hypothetical protein [Flavobacterium ajazii]|uniref:hypothetical protein n=1 Tax=Flavobacterium ajazii TaxID=2692318 RepID=UPI0013D7B21D|nr:hypothetical protein [Flavobacterium ajazii]
MKNRKRNRMQGFDYSSDNLYFVTICVQDRICCFGYVGTVGTGRDLSVHHSNENHSNENHSNENHSNENHSNENIIPMKIIPMKIIPMKIIPMKIIPMKMIWEM